MKTTIILTLCLLWTATSFAAGAHVDSDLTVNGTLYLNGSSLTTSNGLLKDKGTWSSGTTYSAGDVVQYLGSSYVATTASIAQTPSNASFWAVLAKGATGTFSTAGCAKVFSGSPTFLTSTSTYVTAYCPAGQTAVSGGYSTANWNSSVTCIPVESMQSGITNNSWQVTWAAADATVCAANSVTTWALCCP